MSCAGLVVDFPNSSKSKKFYLCLSFERSYLVPAALGTVDSGACVENTGRKAGRYAIITLTMVTSSLLLKKCMLYRVGKKSTKSKKSAVKSVDWIVKKKERMRKQGKAVKSDSKFTGRKRSTAF